jgi:hypothetical protein
MADELDELAAKGRASDARNAAAQRRAEAVKAHERADKEEIERWRAVTWWAMLTSATKWTAALFLVFGPMFLATILVMSHFETPATVAFFVLPVAPVVGTALVMLAAPAMCRRAVAREARWAASLPFAVTGYLDCLGSYYDHNERCMYLAFAFEGEPPAALRDILAADGGTWTVEAALATRDPGLTTRFKEDHNRKVVRWFRTLVRQQLLPLHAKYPFREVEVSNYDRGRRGVTRP